MPRIVLWRIALVVVMMAAAGCNGSSPAEALADAGVDAAIDAPPPAIEQGHITDQDSGDPVAGASLCIVDHAEIPCGTTDATGAYTIAMPQSLHTIDFAQNFTAPGYLGTVTLSAADAFPAAVIVGTSIRTAASATAYLHDQAGLAYPVTDTGFVVVSLHNAGSPPGTTVTLVPPPGAPPVYFNASGLPDPTLTSTSANGDVLFGSVPPGRFNITVTGATCQPLIGGLQAWRSALPYAAAGEAVAGSLTLVDLDCTAPAAGP